MAAKLLTGTTKFDNITPVLKSSHWLYGEKRIDFKVLLLVYHALHNQAPEYTKDMLQERTNVQTLRSTVSSSSEQTQRLGGLGFCIAAMRLWNALLGYITDCKSIGYLKKKIYIYIKTDLFKSDFA